MSPDAWWGLALDVRGLAPLTRRKITSIVAGTFERTHVLASGNPSESMAASVASFTTASHDANGASSSEVVCRMVPREFERAL